MRAMVAIAIGVVAACREPTSFVCGFPSREAFDASVATLTDGQENVGACSIRRTGELLELFASGELVYSQKDGGAAYGYAPVFEFRGVRPGDDVELVAKTFIRKRWTVGCSHDASGGWCRFRPLSRTHECDGNSVTIRLRGNTAPPAEIREPSQLRGQIVAAVAVSMPC